MCAHPMQWSSANHAGFSKSQPWINVNPNYREVNLEEDRRSPAPIFAFYRKMIAFRKKNATLTYGSFELLLQDHPCIFAYTRQDNDARFLILLNLSAGPQKVDLDTTGSEISLSNYSNHTTPIHTLRPWEATLLNLPR